MKKEFKRSQTSSHLRKNEERHMTHSEVETFALAKKIGAQLQGNEVVLLYGELGAGKTVFAKGLAAGVGMEDVHQVCSPSFTLVNIYPAKFPIFHIDLYRLKDSANIWDLGWEDYLDQGIIIVEWAEKIQFEMEAIRVIIEVKNNEKRLIKIRRINKIF